MPLLPDEQADRADFTMIDNGAIERIGEIGPAVFSVYVAIASHAYHERKAYPGVQTLAKMTGLTPQWVRHSIRKLKTAGWVAEEQIKGHPNEYTLPPIPSTKSQLRTPELSTKPRFPKPRNSSFAKGETPVSHKKTNEEYLLKNKRGCAAGIAIPVELDSEDFRIAWSKWLAYRRERKLTCTPMTLNGQLKKFAAVGRSQAITEIEHSIGNGWQSVVYAERERSNGHSPKPDYKTGPGQIFDPTAKRLPVKGSF
jgi:hypothetical protein